MDDELFLAIRRIGELDLVVEHFEIIDAVEGAADELVARGVDRSRNKSCAAPSARELGRLARLRAPDQYWIVTRNVESSASTCTDSTTIRSPSHCCSAP